MERTSEQLDPQDRISISVQRGTARIGIFCIQDLSLIHILFRVMQSARSVKDSRKIMEHLSDPAVEKVFSLSRQVGNEAHRFLEFVRFRELKNGVLFSEIVPKNRILSCIADHFSDRFPLENWKMCIRDRRTDDMKVIRGVNVFPTQVETALLSMGGAVAPHYLMIVDREDNLDVLTVMVEVDESMFSDEIRKLDALKNKIGAVLKQALGVSAVSYTHL